MPSRRTPPAVPPIRGRGGNVWRNWGHNQRCRPATVETPGSELEVAEAVRRAAAAGQTVKAVGSGHSFTGVACTDGRHLRLDRLDRVVALDEDAGTVTVEAGIPLFRLNEELAVRGLALANLGDIDRQTISGAIATATHGTGVRFGGLATFVQGLEMVTADGELLRCSADEEPEVFHCARVGLGALGIVTRLTLQCVPAFRLHALEQPAAFDDVMADLDDAVDRNDHFEFYWLPHTDRCSTKENNRTTDPVRRKDKLHTWRDEIVLPNAVFGAACWVGRAAPSRIPAIAGWLAGTFGRLELVDRSDRIFCSPRLVHFVEMEYAIPREHAKEAVDAVRDLIDDEGLLISFPIEVRFVAADDIPLSTAFGRESCYIAVHVHAGADYERYFHGVEAVMDRFAGRPHWGKLHFQSAATLAPRYPEFERFRAVRRRLDPDLRFTNEYLDRVLGDE
jgi:L-gulono-1,4-lactone dehydrogenase